MNLISANKLTNRISGRVGVNEVAELLCLKQLSEEAKSTRCAYLKASVVE